MKMYWCILVVLASFLFSVQVAVASDMPTQSEFRGMSMSELTHGLKNMQKAFYQAEQNGVNAQWYEMHGTKLRAYNDEVIRRLQIMQKVVKRYTNLDNMLGSDELTGSIFMLFTNHPGWWEKRTSLSSDVGLRQELAEAILDAMQTRLDILAKKVSQ